MAVTRWPASPLASNEACTGTALTQTANTSSSTTPITNSGTDDSDISAIVMARSERRPSR